MILITGATGHLGNAIIDHLLKNTTADKIIAFARDEKKAAPLKEKGIQVRLGSYDDTASLENAVQGVEKVLLVSAVEPERRLQQHANVVDAAKKAGVRHIIYTSMLLKDVHASAIRPFMESILQTEDYIKQSGLTYTLLRNTLYTDGIPMFVGEKVLETGIFLPAGNGKVPYALRREMGEAAANVLLQRRHENKTYEITGNTLYSYDDVAKQLSELSGKAVNYIDADATIFPAQLKKFGLPDIAILVVAGFSADIKHHQYEIVSKDLEILLGRKPASLRDGLKELYNF